MNIHVLTKDNQNILEGMPATSLLESAEDVIDVLGTCFEHNAHAVLLYGENLTEHFFDLSSGEAGAILQKFRSYHIKLAVVASPTGVQQSPMFREMLIEESKGDDFRVFSDRVAAEAWLIDD